MITFIMTTFGVSIANAQLRATSPINNIQSIQTVLLCNIVGWIFTLAIVFSILFTLVAAYTYMTSEGNEEKVSQATRSLQWVAIGVAVAILASAMPYIVASVINGNISGTICSGGASSDSGGSVWGSRY